MRVECTLSAGLGPSRQGPCTATLSGVVVALAITAGRPAEAAIGDESVGMNAHEGAPEIIAAAAALGVKWVRLDGAWDVHEPSSDVYNWWLDTAVANATSSGLSVFLSLGSTPAWVARHGDTDGFAYNDVPDTSLEWSDFVADAVVHYRALGVRHFGMWNEPNLDGFFQGSIAEYTSVIVVPGAQAVRSVCSDCFVLGPELAHVGEADDRLEEVLMRVPSGTFDILTHHNYGDFTETGWHIWDGDGFINILDQQRFPFTRRSLKQILDAAGYTGEVWITETGYRATPGDSSEEDTQAIYVRRVLEEQLQRAWYTNTFFYETNDCGVDQPGCTIDGFGLIRPIAGTPGSRGFPSDFRLKPAFSALQSFIQSNPSIVGTAPPKQCGDGADNDGDGRTDLADRGCGGAQDDDEGDDPPRMRVAALPLSTFILDGDLSEIGVASDVTLDPASWRGTEPLASSSDLGVRATVRWRASGLYVAVEVTDDVHDNTRSPEELWMGDSIQIAFDIGRSGGVGYDTTDDHEIGFALTGAGIASYRFHGPANATNDFSAAVVRSGSRTLYELELPAAALPGVSWQAGTVIGFSFLANDADSAGRIGWMEWTPGIGTSKAPELFGEIELILSPEPDGGTMADSGSTLGDASSDAAPDASTPPRDASPDSRMDDALAVGDDAADAGQPRPSGAPDADPPRVEPGGASPGNEGCGCSSTRVAQAGAPWSVVLTLFIAALAYRTRRTRAGSLTCVSRCTCG